jgi:phenylalanyl-tRNA synthetase beta chain
VYSRRRETAVVRLFETGAAFLPAGETERVAWLMTGARQDHWSGAGVDADVFDAKGIAELLGEAFGVRVIARPSEAYPWFVRGRAADLLIAAQDSDDVPAHALMAGSIGQLRPELVAARGLGQGSAVVGGEIDPLLLAREGHDDQPARIDPLPRHPSIVRDLSIIVSERLPAADVRGTIRSIAPRTLASVHEFDRYQGKGVSDGSVSLSIRLTFRDRDRTLTDTEVQRAVDAIVKALVDTHGAVLRGRTDG